nr:MULTISPECIES: D-alanyl-D-alanine carboxypeptidase/D-alanyl-D-alanine-endopeptidase [unclassified Schaalia]
MVILSVTALLFATVGYVVADLYDRVPGFLTFSQAVSPAAPPALPHVEKNQNVQWKATEGNPVDPKQLEHLWQKNEAAAAEGGWKSWAKIVDATTGETLLEKNTSQAHTPASVTKILTAYAALTHLSPSQRLATGVSREGTNLYLWGQGDLLLGAGTGNPDAVNGQAGVADLAGKTIAALNNNGVNAVQLYWAPQPFTGPSHLNTWDQQNSGDYEGHVAAFAVDAGRIDGQENAFYSAPAATVATLFADYLRAAGITVEMISEAAPPENTYEVARIESATQAQQIRYMLEQSDNTLADQYCRLTARTIGAETSYSGAVSTLILTLQNAGIPTQGIHLDDCSGLSENDRVSADTLIATIFDSVREHKTPAVANLVRSLPIAGVSGTLTSRLQSENTRANVQAKTGTLGKTVSMAGVLTTTSGRLLIFALGNDDVPRNEAVTTRPHIDEFLHELSNL